MTAQQDRRLVGQGESNPYLPSLDGIGRFLFSSDGMLMLTCVGLLILLGVCSGRKKGKLARGYFAGSKERRNARKKAYSQIKKRQHNAVGGFLGQPRGYSCKQAGRGFSINLPMDPRLTYVADCQRGVIATGGAGSGKSASLINPLVKSFVMQHFPIILYDFKYSTRPSADADFKGQAPPVAGFAKKLGYDITVFAPGFPETCVCNPLDFIRSETGCRNSRPACNYLKQELSLIG